MSTFKYVGTDPLEVAGLFQLRLSEGQTFEIVDDGLAAAFDEQFGNDPRFVSSRTKNPDVVTGTIPVQSSDPAPAA